MIPGVLRPPFKWNSRGKLSLRTLAILGGWA